ncbi:MAG: hypothetical protein IKI94_11390 [Ruminococcus sp.]|nr:hypothetical protein [Ruminococcus sp.]
MSVVVNTHIHTAACPDMRMFSEATMLGSIEENVFTLICRIKSEYPHIRILFLTAFYDDKNIAQAISGGADGYLLKDSGKDAILGGIDRYPRQSKAYCCNKRIDYLI